MIYSAFHSRLGFAEILITLLAFITAPVSANLIAQAAIHLRLRSTSGDVPEAITYAVLGELATRISRIGGR